MNPTLPAVAAVACGFTFGAATVVDPQSILIPLTTALAVAGSVWAAARRFQSIVAKNVEVERRLGVTEKGIVDLVRQVKEGFDKVDSSLKDMKGQRTLDIEILRSEIAEAATGKRPAMAPRSNKKVLLVEDDANDRELFRRTLSSIFDIDVATSMAQATQMAKTQAYDCVVLDLLLPDSSEGRTVEEFLREIPSAVCVVITGNQNPALIAAAKQQGASAYIFKSNQDRKYLEQTINNAIMRNL